MPNHLHEKQIKSVNDNLLKLLIIQKQIRIMKNKLDHTELKKAQLIKLINKNLQTNNTS